jgi:hypothetical protein
MNAWRITCFLVLLASIGSAAGQWQVSEKGVAAQTDRTAERAEMTVPLPGDGSWRCIVEPGPFGGGMSLAADGLTLELADTDGGTLRLLGPDGKELWRDMGVGWSPYEPLWLEVVREAQRIRVQMLLADGKSLVAMSPWFPLPKGLKSTSELRLATLANTARFTLWQRVAKPLAEYTPNNPSALRVPQAGDSSWLVVGGGAWRWRTIEKKQLQQTRKIERTTLIRNAKLPAEGTYRSRIRLDKGTCGGGMLVHTDAKAESGYLVLKNLWSSPQGKWRWNTDYVLEATIADGKIQARMLAADGKTAIATSRPVKLLPEEQGRQGFIAYQTWRGTGHFWPDAVPGTTESAPKAKGLGGGWTATSGDWQLARGTLRCTSDTGTALCEQVRGARGVFRCRVTADGATGVSLLFQRSPEAGFECRLDGKGVTLADAKGKTMWSDPSVRLAKGRTYQLAGIVDTDRVMVRVLDEAGKALIESVERYVSDTNNDRMGVLGVSCTGGPATFSGWSWTAP